MKYTLNRQAELPAYLQIYNMIRRDITSGLIAPGAKLPSKRLLADELQVSVITVEHAYALLADEGYIQSRQRSGYYVIYRAGELLSVLEKIGYHYDEGQNAFVP